MVINLYKAIKNEAIKKYSIITKRIELFPVLLIYFKIKKLPIQAATVHKVPMHNEYGIFNWPDKTNMKEEAIAVKIIKNY